MQSLPPIIFGGEGFTVNVKSSGVIGKGLRLEVKHSGENTVITSSSKGISCSKNVNQNLQSLPPVVFGGEGFTVSVKSSSVVGEGRGLKVKHSGKNAIVTSFSKEISCSKDVNQNLQNLPPVIFGREGFTVNVKSSSVFGEGGGLKVRHSGKNAIITSSSKGISCSKNVNQNLQSLPPVVFGGKGFTVNVKSSSVVGKKRELKVKCSRQSTIVNPAFRDISDTKNDKSVLISSGLQFEAMRCDTPSQLYREITIRFCSKLRDFRRLHFNYCIKLMNKMFKVKNGEFIISKPVVKLFVGLTQYSEILFFILKVFCIVNLSTLCGGRDVLDRMRYCSTSFYDQSLLNFLLSKVILSSTQGVDILACGRKLREMFEIHCEKVSSHEPYSGEFFQIVFSICHNLASVELPEENQELIDFAMLACMVYCGHMVSLLCRMLAYNHDAEGGEKDPLLSHLKARGFCNRCYDLRKTMVHMYHPASETECPSNVGNVIDVPLIMWRRCSKEIHSIVKDCHDKGNLHFGVFVRDIIRPVKGVILRPNTMRFYASNIEMYNKKIKLVESLLPLPYIRCICK